MFFNATALASERMHGHPGLGLGLDAGGTQTRWALTNAEGQVLAEGQVGPLNAMQVGNPEGRQLWLQTLQALAGQVLPLGQPLRLHAGLTGFGGSARELQALISGPFGLEPQAISVSNDVEVAYRDVFLPGEGHLVYAGTGSIAVHLDAQEQLHRAGGLGGVLDDGGSGYWIGREALRHVWRTEDEEPGAWQRSPMAQALMHETGGHEWLHTRQFLVRADRGAMGLLALAVAQTAQADSAALNILQNAGRELARLARILVQRQGAKPIVLAGRVLLLHPAIEQACRAALPQALTVNVRQCQGHHAAARLAAQGLRVRQQPPQ